MPNDKRRWTTAEQLQWLERRHPDYLEAQSNGRYDRFWPGLFQDWFAVFPAREPAEDDPTDSEPEAQPDLEAELQNMSTTDSITTPSKRKDTASNNGPNKRKKKMVSRYYYYCIYHN